VEDDGVPTARHSSRLHRPRLEEQANNLAGVPLCCVTSSVPHTRDGIQHVRATNDIERRALRRADLASGVGAGVLGIAIGGLFHDAFAGYLPGLFVLGLLMHARGMYDKHRRERDAPNSRIWWSEALYAVCWLSLAALALYIGLRTFRPGAIS
jgi:hypothetical protein